MPTLRISHTAAHVEATFEGDGPRQSEKRPFSLTLSAQEAEDIRWYLEDYRIYPLDPAPKIAKRIEQRMSEAGRELFHQVLAGSAVWESVRRNLADVRIEVETEVEDALVPWELMRDPVADQPLALDVPSFVRCHSRPARSPNPPGPAPGKIRILLVICRLEDDRVPFRSVARHLIRGLSEAAREPFHLEVLRPPTFEQLARRLREAKAQGEPFHVVHFDGHGLSGEVFFENPQLERNAQSVKAAEFGKLLHEARVPLLILNACRSADSEPPEQPKPAGDVHQQIREFGSLAHAVMDSGASGVVAWRYSVFVDTAAQYMADLYAALASGLPLGEAATLARKQLSSANRPIEDRCLVQLGYAQFLEAINAHRPGEECDGHLSKAEAYYKQALEMFPANAVGERTATHNELGTVYMAAGQADTALRHYSESVRYCEVMQDRFAAGKTRYNAAIALARAGRFADAREWAQAALRDLKDCENADQDVVDTIKLLELIESGLRATSPPS